jgi:ribonuclease R
VVRHQREEVSIELSDDDEKMGFTVLSVMRGDAERFNEQLSLACNIEGARFLRDDRRALVQPIYRVHEPPSDERVAAFQRLVAATVRHRRLDPDRYLWNAEQTPLAEYLAGLPTTGDDARTSAAIARQAIMINMRSVFRAEPGEHHGIGADVYARFSAPMREIVGVYVHKEAWERLDGRQLAGPTDDQSLREQVIEAANRSKQLQRDIRSAANRLVIDRLLASRRDRPLVGTVMGVTNSKIHVTLDDPPIEVKVYVRHLRDVHGAMTIDEDEGVCTGPNGRICALGDAVMVEVDGRESVPRGEDRWRLRLSPRTTA